MDLMSRIEPTLGILEEEYRLTFLKGDMRLSSIGIVLWILFTISFAYNDYLFFGKTGQFWLLAFCRAALASYGIVLLFVFTKLEKVAIYERLVFTFLIVAALFVFYVDTTRPPSYQMNLTLDVLIIFSLYLLFPISVGFRTIVGFLFSLCAIVTVTMYGDFSVSPATITIFLSLILANAAGLIVSARWGDIRRDSFKALIQSQTAAERFLQAKTEWQLTFDSVPDLIMILDEKHSIIRANKATADRLGMTPEDLVGQKCFQYFHGEESTPSFCFHSKVLGDGKPHQGELTEGRLGGTFDVSVSPLFDVTGRLRGSVHVARDITARKQAEEALRESEERFRTLVAHSPMAIAVTGPNGELEYLNRKFVQVFGYTLKDIPTLEHWWRLAYPDPQYAERVKFEWLRATRESADKKSEAQPVEREIRCKDGRTRLIEVRKTATDRSVVHTFDDITARRQAEEALRESEERYRLLVDLSPDGICMYSEGRYVFANKAMATILGLQTPEELVGKQHLDLIHPEYRELVKERMAAVLTHDKPVPMVEEKVIRSDGTVVDVEVAAAPVSYQGQPAGLAVIRDITARKQDEHKREQLLEELQNALAEVKKLSGFLPICASCKKIRDDKGYWQQIEQYISDHSEAVFSHSVCPDCAKKLYPDLFDY